MPELPVVDEPPAVWVEHDALELTDREIADGNLLGKVIDTDDDEDNGLDTIGGPPR